MTQQAGSLAGFDHSMFTHDGRAHEVFRAGTGPAVIVIHEMPGLHPGVVEFAQRLIVAGYTVFLPSLFGRPGEPFSNAAIRRSVAGVAAGAVDQGAITAEEARRWLDQLARAADDGTFLWGTTGFAVAATTPASTS